MAAAPEDAAGPTAERPWLRDVGVLALVPDRWHDYWQPRHHLLSRLARYFPVVWVEPAAGWRELLERPDPSPTPHPAPPPGLEVFPARRGPPRLFRPAWAAGAARRLRLERARRRLLHAGCRQVVLYLWRLEFAEARGAVRHDLSAYHLDDEYAFDAVGKELDPRERDLLGAVDQVFIHSPALLDKKGGVNPHTLHVPNGVDFGAYATERPEPSDLAAVPRPRIGYTGFLKRQLDWALLERLAADHPEWSFVFVGPTSPHPEVERTLASLARRSNVHLLGGRTVLELAAYPQHFDVCIMPYAADTYTRFIYPLKLHEYLASGSPVVASRIRSLEDFGAVVSLAEGPAGWSRALGAALEDAETQHARREARRAVAARHDWEVLALRVARTLAQRIAPEQAARLPARPSAESASESPSRP